MELSEDDLEILKRMEATPMLFLECFSSPAGLAALFCLVGAAVWLAFTLTRIVVLIRILRFSGGDLSSSSVQPDKDQTV